MTNDYNNLSSRILSTRLAAKIGTKAAFAKEIGVSPTLITYYDQAPSDGKTSADILAKICTSFEWLSARWLLTGTGPALKQSIRAKKHNYIPLLDTPHIPDGSLASAISKTTRYVQDDMGLAESMPYAFGFEVQDDSMAAWGYKHGSVVFLDLLDVLKPNTMSLVLTPDSALIRLPVLAHQGKQTLVGLVAADAPDVQHFPFTGVHVFPIRSHNLKKSVNICEVPILP